MSDTSTYDAIVLVSRPQPDWLVDGARSPLFVCSEMFVDLRDIEVRRWRLWALRNELSSKEQAVVTLADFLVAEDIAALETHGAKVAHEWYLDEHGTDLTIYRSVSLGRCIEYDVKARAIRLLKLVRCLERLRERHPHLPVHTDAAVGSVEHAALERLGITARAFGQPLVNEEPALSPAARPSFKSRLIEAGRHAGLFTIRWLSRLTSRRLADGTPRVVVRMGMQSAMLLQRWLVDRRPSLHFVLWMNYLMRPRTVLSLVRAGHSVAAAPPPVGQETVPAAISDAIRRLMQRPGRHACAIAAPLLDGMLVPLSTAAFPGVCASIDDAHATLSHPDTALLVIPNDCQPLMRAWTLVSKNFGQSTLVLQHGHLDYTEDEDHHTATHSAFWSEMVAEDFRGAGLSAEQVLVTGSPNADDYLRDRAPSAPPRAVRPRILVITTGNPGVQAYIRETWVCDYVAGVLRALQPRFADFEVKMKLHPGENAALYKQYLDELLPPGMEITDRGNLVQMIAETDIIISPPSTVVIEARAGGREVILMPIPTVEGRRSTLADADGVVTVHRVEDLLPAVEALLARSPHLIVGRRSLEDFLGPLDGRSSARLLDVVHDLAHSSAAPSLPRTTADLHAVR